MSPSLIPRVAATILFSCFGAHVAFAQVQTGSILVKAMDEQRSVLPGTTTTITSPALVVPMVGVTDNSGVYRFPSLPPGLYTMKLELPSFVTLVRDNIVVSVGLTTSLDLTMTLGALSETVTVTGSSPVVDTTSANVNVTLTQQILQATPSGHDIWSLLEAKVPGLTMSRPDVGGASGGSQGGFVARGTTSAQNTYYINGVNAGSGSSIGNTSFYFDYNAFQEVQVSTSGLDLSVSSPGVFVNLVTKTGGDRFSGLTSYYWEGQQLQSANVDSNLLNYGLRSDAGAVDFVSDANGQFGGPVIKDKLRFFTAYRDWRINVGIPGFAEVDKTINKTIQGTGTYQLNDKNRLTAYLVSQWFKRPTFGSSALVTPASSQIEDNHFQLYQGLWNSVFSNTAFLDARFSAYELYFPLYQEGGDAQSLQDLSTGLRTLNAANTTISDRHRYQASVNIQKYIDHALGGRHELRVGVDNQYSPVTTSVSTVGDVNLAYRSQPTPTASTVTLFNTPLVSAQALNVLAIFAQDSYTVGRVTVAGGVRWERLEGYLPAQSSPASQYFPDATRSFPEIRNIISWKDAAPRASVAYDLLGNGKTAIKASAGRYLYQISTDTPNTVNKNFSSSATYSWNDVNHDLQFAPNELGALLSRSGASVTSIDPNIRRPHTDEISAGIDHEVLPNLRFSVMGTFRRERDLTGNVDVGVPFNSYRPVTKTDLGPDGLAGTSDDGSLQVWDQDPATRGQDAFVLTNSAGLNQRYRGIEFTVDKRFSHNWQLLTGYTYSQTIVNATDVSNPNSLINSTGSTAFDRPHTFKATGSYTFSRDIVASANYHIQSGLPIARTETFALTQGNVTVNATAPGSDRLDPLATLDARIAKVFKFGGRQFEVGLDGFNLLNANTIYAVRTLTGRINVNTGGLSSGALVNQPQYLSPTSILNPRLVRLGFAFRF